MAVGEQHTREELTDVAHVAYLDPLRLPHGMEPGLEAHKAYDPPAMTYSNATHLCEALVDTRTGGITLTRYLVVEDCGAVLNPLIVEGQQHGAVAMGIGGVLLEEVVYDENGQNRSGSFADYLLPTARDVPELRVLVTEDAPSPLNPLGLKGAGEGGANPVGAAIASAIDDALGMPGAVTQLPVTPRRLRELLRVTPSSATASPPAAARPRRAAPASRR